MSERRVVIAGYYGFGNAGDEAILEATVGLLGQLRPNWHLMVLSADPAGTAQTHGVQAIPRFHLTQVARALFAADLFLFGGGSLLQDTTSLRSLLYYLGLLNLPLWAGRRVMVYANGFGPVRRTLGRWGCRHTLNRVPVITVRDADSQRELLALGVTRPHLQVTADPAFLLRPVEQSTVHELLLSEGLDPDRSRLLVAVRRWPGLNTGQLARSLDEFCRQHQLEVLFIPMHGALDRGYAREVASTMRGPSRVLARDYPPRELLGIIGSGELLLGMRMHAIIFAAIAGVPAAGLSYDPKVTSLLHQLGLPVAGYAHQLSPEHIAHQLGQLWTDRQHVSQRLGILVEEKRQAALENIQQALALMEAGTN